MSAVEFNMDANLTVEQKLDRVCHVILSCGLGVRGGEIVSGGNNVLVNKALDSISRDELAVVQSISDISYFDAAGMVFQAKAIQDNEELRHILLPYIAEAAIKLKVAHGFFKNVKPLNWDLNAVGAKRATYVEPTGVAKAFVDAFGIAENKGPSVGQRPAIKHMTPHGGIMAAREHQPR